MAEYWKSTPKYWCKHCACYVRDTKLERQNHEATGKHQGALKRFLRDLHRGHERGEREKDRAKQEIERLNGVVGSSSSSGSGSYAGAGRVQAAQPVKSTEAELKKQREQLASLGVAMPETFRPEMAMPGEWTVTNTTIIEPKKRREEVKVETKATGVRKREETDEKKEEEDAVQALFKKPRRWGRDSRTMPQEDEQDLDDLLNGSAIKIKKSSTEEDLGSQVKQETGGEIGVKNESADEPTVKSETEEASRADLADTKPDPATDDAPSSKVEGTEADVSAAPAPVTFKKRKPKGIRQK